MTRGYYQLPYGRVAALDGDCLFPPLNQALTEPNGLIAIGGDLSVARLLSAYQQGIFPWFNDDDPILWWSPNPRMVLIPDELKVSKSLAKTLKNSDFEIRFNTAFLEVITACSQTPRASKNGIQISTWITQDIIDAYCAMFDEGYGVSAETWCNGQLVGGCYGIKLGHMFYGESMFHRVTDASKVAFVNLVQKLKSDNVGMIDCQMKTAHLGSLGAREISRDSFAQQVLKLVHS